jgi:drug/metabolite transporter (DMT)-like permease
MSLAVPVSALMAALLPVAVGSFLQGLPGVTTFAGFGLALAAIWFISKPQRSDPDANIRPSDLFLPLVAGVGFGMYFILVHQGNQGSIIWPMVASRSGGSIILVTFLLFTRQGWKPTRAAMPLIVLNAVLDIGGNAFYIVADQFGRMDVAAVLSSLYPASTIGLAWLVLKERITPMQWIGILLALAALALIAWPSPSV